jgi:hypothetical protein
MEDMMQNITKRYPITAPKGISGERYLFTVLQRHYDVVSDYTENFAMQCRGVDFGIKKTNWSRERLLDVKNNLWIADVNDRNTWNVMLELSKSKYDGSRIGWFHTSQADRIYHVNTYHKMYVYYDLNEMRRWVTREIINGNTLNYTQMPNGSELLNVSIVNCPVIIQNEYLS